MFKIRKEQMEVLSDTRIKNLRRAQIQDFRARGLKAGEHSETRDLLLGDAAGGTARIASQSDGVSITSGEGRTHSFEYDSQGSLKAVTDPARLRVDFEHDEKGRLTTVRRGTQNPYRFEFDDKENLTAIHFPDNTATHFASDAAGQALVVTDRNQNETRYEYSGIGQPVRLMDPMRHETRFEYDGWDLPSAVIFPNGDRHEFEYDAEGRLQRILENGKEHATCHLDDGAGIYDVAYTDGTKAHFVLSGSSILEATNETCTVKLEYDSQGRILREDTDGQVVEYLRNEVGALVGIVTPDGEKLIFKRDKEQRVYQITDWSGSHYEIGYEPNGVLASIKYPNGSSTTLKATPMGLTASLTVQSQGRPSIACQWEYDECDRVTRMTKDDATHEYRYDAEGRFIEVRASGLGGSEHFELDANGNRVKDQAGTCRFNGLNQLVQRGSEAFTYDGRGNMTSGPCPKGGAIYTYNGRDQLVVVMTSAGQTRYAYDAFGRRIRKERDGEVTRYVWAGHQLLTEITTSEEKTARRDYMTFPERSFPLAMRVDGNSYYLHPGRRAEPRCMTDVKGEVVWKADYSAFGQARIAIEKVSQPWRLAGQHFDEETGLHYVLARYYNPELGRYLTMDQLRVEGGSLNFYTYCDGDPINHLDPTGEFIFTAILIGAAIGAAIGAGIEAYRQSQTKEGISDGWGIVKAGLIGGAIGAIGGGVGAAIEAAAGATTLAGLAGAGALSGMGSSAVEQCAEAALTGNPLTAGDFLTNVLIGGTIGTVTAGIGGLFARRARRLAQTERLTRRSVDDKLTRYLLNEAHPVGRTKAKWFKEALGFTQENGDDLARQIVFDPKKAVQTAITEHGTKFNQVIEIVGANGKKIPVTFAWIENKDGVVRLVTAIPTRR